MNTPNKKPKMRLGLSRPSSSIKKVSSSLTPLISAAAGPSGSTSSPSPGTSTNTKIHAKNKFALASLKYKESLKASEEEEITEQNIEEKQKADEEMQKRHEIEKEELIALTEKWKQAGLEGIERLRAFIREPMTDEQILDGFNIPHEYFL